jgi:hypothetical protein
VRGNANVWAASPPIAEDSSIPGAEVFASPPSLDLDGGESLQLRRFFRYEVVPLREGALAIPRVRIPYYDVATGRYAVAEAEAVDVTVLPRPPTPPQRARRARGSDPAATPSPETARGFPWATSLLGAATLLGLGVFGARRASSRRPWKRVDALLAEASAAADRGDPVEETGALARALRVALELAHPELAAADAAALRSRSDDPELAEVASLLEALDWIRYAGEFGHPDRQAIHSAIDALRTRFRSGARR